MIDAAEHRAWPQLMMKLREFIARRVVGSDVDDVLQEALLRVQRGASKLRDAERFGPWVYQVTRSAVADHLRLRARSLRPSPTDSDPLPSTESAAAEDDALRAGLVSCLSVFVAQLPSPYREAITLTELEGLTQSEAAVMLGISLSGMKSRVQRGRAQVRELFTRCCAMEQDARGRVIACDPRDRDSACSCSSSEHG
jgi:RNA polymerase sigma-70 factor, ECF subfamily